MGRDQKKHLKQKEREQKAAEGRKQAERLEHERRRRDRYPEIEFDTTYGEPEFVRLVREATRGVDFDDPTMFQDWERTTYRQMREHGIGYARFKLRQTMKNARDGDPFKRFGHIAFIVGLGTQILNRIPEDTRQRLMPYNDVLVHFARNKIVLRFSSMLAEKGSNGTVYFSRRKPKIELNGKPWTVAFSRHAIERICERLNPQYLSYAAAGDIHAFFSDCVHFESTLLYGGQPAFTFYNLCHEPSFVFHTVYVKGILGSENVVPSKGKCYYRVDYCPVVFEHGFAKAKTFLNPGFGSTPEYDLVRKSSLSTAEKDLLIPNSTSQNTIAGLNVNPEAIKWFHDHGVPQVVQMKQDVFVKPTLKIA